MRQKRNDLWKLDLLEVKFQKATARFPSTKKLLNARKNTQVMKKLPRTQVEASAQITALKTDLFQKKYHGSSKKLHREVLKKVKLDQRTWNKKDSLFKFFDSSDNLDQLIASKLVKIVMTAVKETKIDPPQYIPDDLRQMITDKTHLNHPSRFFIDHCQNDKVLNGYISKMWNVKEIKSLSNEIEWSFRKIRGNLTQAEKDSRKAFTITKTTTKSKSKDSESEDSEDDSSSDDSGSDAEEAFDKYAKYDNLVGGSDDEEESDQDSGSEDDFFQESVRKEKKDKKDKKDTKEHKLPQLATGYFSGGSDDDEDVDNDEVVKEIKAVRKNRRGQRARQKIWEAKYGGGANHVQKENERIASEREQRQAEFEERQRKREEKARMVNTPGAPSIPGAPQKMHPSWEAKKLADEKLKNVKFTGKKITFD